MRCRSGPVLRRLRNQSVMQGRSSDSFRFRRLPGYPPVAEIVDSSCARFRTGTYSSGNCCRLSRHSLLIGRRLYGLLSEPLRGKDTKFTSNKKCFYFLLVCVVLYWSFCLYQYVASPRHSFRSLYKYPVANIVKIDNTVRNTIVLRTIGGCLR